MRKWIINHPEKDGQLKLVADYNKPYGALCEAPEHFTNEMEPFFQLIPMGQNPDGVKFSVKVSDAFNEKQEAVKQAAIKEHHRSNLAFNNALKSAKHKDWFNGLNPFQRAVVNLLGDRLKVSKGPLRNKIVGKIFGAHLKDKP